MKNSNGYKAAETHIFDRAITILDNGGIVAFPTETYYGLGVDPYSQEALKRLFFIKKRPLNMPILVLVDGLEMLYELVDSIPDFYLPLMEQYWPGPLTLLFPARKHLSEFLTGGTETIGIRRSPNPLVDRLLRIWGKPITATSANISGELPATNVAAVAQSFGDSIDYIIDGGNTPGGKCSTIIGCTQGRLKLVRPGQLTIKLD